MSFVPPEYPYARLDDLRKIAQRHEGGVIDCSVGTPVDPPPAVAMDVLRRGEGARADPPSAGTTEYREAAANWVARRFKVELDPDDVAACVGTKEFVSTVANYLHLRVPLRDTVLYPAISYPTYAMGATLAGLRAVPVPMTDGRLELGSIDPSEAERALV